MIFCICAYSKSKSVLLGLMLLCCGAALGQQQKDILPPSPQTAEFVKYINYNVTPYNGLPEISIPLYNIVLKDLSIPISLSYHASGIKFNQTSGDVGVGWSLNPGYRVSRTVYGRPDELYAKPDAISVEDSLQYYQNDPSKTDAFVSKFLYKYDMNIPRPYNHEMVDGEFDMFDFSLPTENGSFIITDRVNRIVRAIEGSNVKFSYNTAPIGIHTSIASFQLTDEQGIKYYMGAASAGPDIVYEASSNDYQGHLATAWALRELVTPSNEKVEFSYNTGIVDQWRQDLRSVSITEGFRCYGDVPGSSTMGDVGVGISYSTFFTDEIKTDKEIVRFIRNSSTNMVSKIEIYTGANTLLKSIQFFYNNNAFHTFLDSVKVLDKNNASREVYRFDYYARNAQLADLAKDQWGYYMPGNPINIFHNQIKDDPIFYYETPEANVPNQWNYTTVSSLIANTFARDHISTAPDFFSLKKITYPTGGSVEYEYESNMYSEIGNSIIWGGGLRIKEIRSADLVKQVTLRRRYTYGINQNGVGKAQYPINYRDFATESIHFTTSSWVDFASEQYAAPIRTINYSTTPSGDVDVNGFLGSAVIYPEVNEMFISPTEQEEGVIKYLYDIEAERYGAMGLNKGLKQTTGCGYVTLWNDYRPAYVYRYSTWKKPHLKEKSYYEYKNSSYRLIKKEEYIQSPEQLFTISGFKVKSFASSPNYDPLVYNYYNYINSFFDYGTYTIEGGRSYLVEKRETTYTLTDSIVNTIQYSNTELGHTASETNFGNNDKTITEYTYPYDLKNINSSTPLNQSVLLLNSRNKLASPIETRVYKVKNNETVKELVSASFIQYKPDALLPERVLRTENSELVTNFSPVAATGGLIEIDASYRPVENIDAYDQFSNVLETHKEGDVFNTYIWDYGNKYPIAQTSNARYNQVAYTSFEAEGKGNWGFTGLPQVNTTAPTGSKAYDISNTITKSALPVGDYVVSYWATGGGVAVNGVSAQASATVGGWSFFRHVLKNVTGVSVSGSGLIDELRLHPEGAQMSSFTYVPGVGVESTTDPAGKTSYYEYDPFSRLRAIRNQYRNIEKLYDYTYGSSAAQEPLFANDEQSQVVTRNNCGSSFIGGTITYTVPAGRYVRGTKAEANAFAQADIVANAQNYANANASCLVVYYNPPMTQSFIKNDCGPGGFGSQVNYSVAAGAYSSTISQQDADAKAQNEITTNGQIHANTNGACTYPVSYYNAFRSQSFTRNNCGVGGTGAIVNYEVPAAKYTSTISQADADAQAVAEADSYGQNYANANGVCSYANTAMSQTFTKNDCTIGGVPGSINYSVAAGLFVSNVSQQHANELALEYLQTNGQANANANSTCTYKSAQRSQAFTKNCGVGGTGTSHIYTVEAGTYTSYTGQAEADAQAQADVDANGQNYANAHGTCTYYNTARSQNFSRNNCPANYSGSTVGYAVPAGTHFSNISQLDAEQKATDDIQANGQNYANANGTCTLIYYSISMTQTFIKSGCDYQMGRAGDTLNYHVPVGKYTSLISQQDADAQAQAEINTQGQAYADANLSCLEGTLSVTINNEPGLGIVSQIVFIRPDNSSVTIDAMGMPGPQTFTIPSGYYHKAVVHIGPTDSDYSATVYSSYSTSQCQTFSAYAYTGATVEFYALNLKGMPGFSASFSVTSAPCYGLRSAQPIIRKNIKQSPGATQNK